MTKRDTPINMVPDWQKPTLSERHFYWIACAVLLGIILIQWGV